MRLIVPLIIGISLVTGVAAAPENTVVIGGVEDAILFPWKIKIPARIDTGAATSSLDVCELKRLSHKEVEFRLPERCGGAKIRRPVISWRRVKSTEGNSEGRPMVEVELCLGSRRLRTEVTLNDRSAMEFPLLIGRNTLEGHFVVDVSRSKTLSPACPEDPSP